MTELHVLRVFCGSGGTGGNHLGVVLDGAAVPATERQAGAAAIGFSETVFVDDPSSGTVQIFTPTVELPFAGHPLVGTAWLLATEGEAVPELNPPAGHVPARVEGDRAHVVGRPEWAPEFEWAELGSAAEVEALDGPPGGHDLIGAYAWVDEETVRCRVFPRRLGIAEDEATGAAAVRLGAIVARAFTIRQGRGSEIQVCPAGDGAIEIGGRVVLDEVRPYPSPGVRAT
ncbi:MAG: PhzF family phenazine biosynthesis protein [Actinomycetota bacterium]